jgi:hypothetical protein
LTTKELEGIEYLPKEHSRAFKKELVYKVGGGKLKDYVSWMDFKDEVVEEPLKGKQEDQQQEDEWTMNEMVDHYQMSLSGAEKAKKVFQMVYTGRKLDKRKKREKVMVEMLKGSKKGKKAAGA